MNMMRMCAAVLLAGLAAGAEAQTVEQALKLYDASKYEDAARVLRAVPEPAGRAQGLLCELYLNTLIVDEGGQAKAACAGAALARDPHGLLLYAEAHARETPPAGIPHDPRGFIRYLSEAVELQYPFAFDRFCEYFYTQAMYTQATPFCKVAAASHIPQSMYRMAQMLFEGKGAVQNFERGNRFARASAQMGYAPAYVLLAELSAEGKMGAARDPVQAYAWYSLAMSEAPDWEQPAQARKALELPGEQVALAQKIAAQWVPVAPPRGRDFYRKD